MSHRRFLPLSAPGLLILAALLLATPASAISSPTTAKEACKKPDKKPPAPPPCDKCSDLPRLNKELAEQQFLRDRFQEFIDWRLPPLAKDPGDMNKSAGELMRDWVTREFTKYLNSPEGGGNGFGQPEMGTDLETCKLVSYPKDDKGKNLTDKNGNPITCPVSKDDIKAMYCQPVADMILTHEGQHQKDCAANKKASPPLNLAEWNNYAVYDVRGYTAGIANLRKSIAALSRNCGWKGSSNKTKKMPVPPAGKDKRTDIDVDVIPTPQQIDTLAKTLGGKK